MKFHTLKTIATGLGLFCLAFFPQKNHAQDMLASQAPIDRLTRAADSIALQRYIETKEMSVDASELYDSWNTEKTHCYSAGELPDSFKIDLRGFAMPTPSRNITSNFGYRPAFRRMHKGVDVKVYTGDTIYAAFDGKARIVRYDAGGYGYYIVLRHSNGLETIYGHLSKQLVSTNQEVKAGEPIGLGGNTGRSFGSHLHFETRLLGEAINPQLLFDFANQDVTGDFYVFHKSQRDNSSTTQVAQHKPARKTAVRTATHYYQVKSGDNLYNIARKLGISVNQLCAANNIRSNSKIRPKQILKY